MGLSKQTTEIDFAFGKRCVSILQILGANYIDMLNTKFSQIPELELFVATRETLRFLLLSSYSPTSLFFPGDTLIDEIWHALILETKAYSDLCSRIRPGRFIHHSGLTFSKYSSEKSPQELHEEQMSWLSSYYMYFGPIDQNAFECLLLAKSLSARMRTDLQGLNEFGSSLYKLAVHNNSKTGTFKSLQDYLDINVLPYAKEISEDPVNLGQQLSALAKWVGSRGDSQHTGMLTVEELDLLFGASTSLAFTFWQHLSVVERLDGLSDWKTSNAPLWRSIASGDTLCGLATTHLAKPDGANITATLNNQNFEITGRAEWVSGFEIFDKLLVGFEADTEIIFCMMDFPAIVGSPSITVCPKQLACLNGTSTVAISFNAHVIPMSSLVSRRSRSIPPQLRPSRYNLPEIGIAFAAIKEIDRITENSVNPRHQLVRSHLKTIKMRIDEIIRDRNSDRQELAMLRDEVIRDSVWLLSLTFGAAGLNENSLVSRLQMELLLTDVIVQSHSSLTAKVIRASERKK